MSIQLLDINTFHWLLVQKPLGQIFEIVISILVKEKMIEKGNLIPKVR